jgi:hypothetical protein
MLATSCGVNRVIMMTSHPGRGSGSPRIPMRDTGGSWAETSGQGVSLFLRMFRAAHFSKAALLPLPLLSYMSPLIRRRYASAARDLVWPEANSQSQEQGGLPWRSNVYRQRGTYGRQQGSLGQLFVRVFPDLFGKRAI